MGLVDFYNKFHKKSSIQRRIITKNNFTYRIVISVVNKFILGERLDVLDYGCGVGTISLFLAKKGNKVVGIDISKRAVQLANQSALTIGLQERTKFFTLGSGKKKIKGKKFDLILCMEVIEHVEDDKALISYLSKHLKRSGLLIISTPSIKAPLHRLGLTKHFDLQVGHLRRYHDQELVKMAENVGLKVVNVIKTEGIIRNSLYIFPILGKLIRFLRGPISDAVTLLDNLTVSLFGESDVFIVAKKT